MCRDGTALYVRENANAVRDAEGKVKYYEGTIEDITDRKRAEAALKKQARELAQTVRALEQAKKDKRASLIALLQMYSKKTEAKLESVSKALAAQKKRWEDLFKQE